MSFGSCSRHALFTSGALPGSFRTMTTSCFKRVYRTQIPRGDPLSKHLRSVPPSASQPLASFSTSYRRQTPPPRSPPTTAQSPTVPLKASTTPPTSFNASKPVATESQDKTDWSIIVKLAGNIWPKNNPNVKLRVIGALTLLVAGKVLNVQVPFFFKTIVDSLNVPITESTTVWVLAGASIAGCKHHFILINLSRDMLILLKDGAARVLTTLFGELRNAIFASVAQNAIRKVARETFEHLLNMDMKFHLERQTGGLTRAIDRGTKCANPPT